MNVLQPLISGFIWVTPAVLLGRFNEGRKSPIFVDSHINKMPPRSPIFHEDFLHEYLQQFRVPDLYKIKKVLESWLEMSRSGRLDASKEEEIKSRFLMEIFGDVLGFNYKNSGTWLYREEVKTKVDRTKPDAALGIFHIKDAEIRNEVRIVVEVKNADTDLDRHQNRKLKITPVDQAFLYASKMGGDCKWVVVTNFTEIRFYASNDQTRFQRYRLADLEQEAVLREFVFLFHRDRFFKGGESSTDRLYQRQKNTKDIKLPGKNIVDELYGCLYKFDQLSFVDPRHLANFKPFNILDEYVWHYRPYQLFTLNHDIYTLLADVRIESGELILSNGLEDRMKKEGVTEYRQKLQYVFLKLNQCLVRQFAAIADLDAIKKSNKNTIGFSVRQVLSVNDQNGICLDLAYPSDEQCDCINCNYRSLDFKRLIKKLVSLEGKPEEATLECAYGHYLLGTDDHKKAYRLYKQVAAETKGSDSHIITYFIANYNQLYLHNLLFDDELEIKQAIRAIDLERIINDEIDIFIDRDIRKVLLDLKEDKLFSGAVKDANRALHEIEQLKALYDRGGRQTGPDYAGQLSAGYLLAFAHIQNNLLVGDAFTGYRDFVATVFKGLLISFRTKEVGIQKFHVFFIIEAILYIRPNDLRELLLPSEILAMDDGDKAVILQKMVSFLKSYYDDGLFGSPHENTIIKQQLLNYHFREKYENIFCNCSIILNHIDISVDEFQVIAEHLVKFISIENELHWWSIAELGNLLESKGGLFSFDQLNSLLKIAVSRHEARINKYDRLIASAADAIRTFYSGHLINDTQLVKKAVSSCYYDADRADLKSLIPLWYILNDAAQKILTEAFEEVLDKEFNEVLYEKLLKKNIIAHDRKNYLALLAQLVNIGRGEGVVAGNEETSFRDGPTYSFLLVPYILQLGFELPEFAGLSGLSNFERWLLNPEKFDYREFRTEWLKIAKSTHIFTRLKGNKSIKAALELDLRRNYDSELSKIYFEYFA